jgi:hypothetical protein
LVGVEAEEEEEAEVGVARGVSSSRGVVGEGGSESSALADREVRARVASDAAEVVSSDPAAVKSGMADEEEVGEPPPEVAVRRRSWSIIAGRVSSGCTPRDRSSARSSVTNQFSKWLLPPTTDVNVDLDLTEEGERRDTRLCFDRLAGEAMPWAVTKKGHTGKTGGGV